jgi:hypothetical protein
VVKSSGVWDCHRPLQAIAHGATMGLTCRRARSLAVPFHRLATTSCLALSTLLIPMG